MTMQNIQNGGGGGGGGGAVNDKLHKQFNNLEQAWDSFKRTKSQCRGTTHRRRRKHCSPMDNGVKALEEKEEELHGLFDHASPSSPLRRNNRVQSGSSEEWNVRTNDLAVLEMLSDSMRGGKFKGRSLHDALESASRTGREEKEEELHFQSGCSTSVLIQGNGVIRRLFSSGSSLGCDCDDDKDDYCNCSSLSNSFSSSLSSVEEKNGKVEQLAKVKKNQVVAVGEWSSGGGKWMALVGWFAILLVVFALGIITWTSFDGYLPSLEYDDFYYPT